MGVDSLNLFTLWFKSFSTSRKRVFAGNQLHCMNNLSPKN